MLGGINVTTNRYYRNFGAYNRLSNNSHGEACQSTNCEIFLSASRWSQFRSSRRTRWISENKTKMRRSERTCMKERERSESEKPTERERERETNVHRKDYDTERRLFEGNGYRDLSDARTVEISIDSQLGRILSVVSSPIPHPFTAPPPPCRVRLLFSSLLHCHLFGDQSRFPLLFTDISAERVSRITTPLSGASYPVLPLSLSSSCSFLFPCRVSLLPFHGSLESSEQGSKTASKLAQ